MRILLAAFSCAPGRGSEPGVGWGMARELANSAEIWVLTDGRNRQLIEAALPAASPIHFEILDLPRTLARFVSNKWLHYLYYLIWQFKAFSAARRLHAAHHFDFVHHVTYVSSWLPTGMGWLGIPFIWNAGIHDSIPVGFLMEMSFSERLWELVRHLALALSGALVTGPLVARRARRILTVSPPSTWAAGLPIVPFAVGGLESEDLRRLDGIPARTQEPIRILSEGRFMGWKGFGLGMQAFARLHQSRPESEYWLVGEGPEEARLRQLARRLGVEKAVKFLPWMPREAALGLLSEVDMLMQPSLHEQFGYVILEAMAAGRPVICMNAGGPSLLVGDGCGVKISVTNPARVVDDLTEALVRLASRPELRLQMGAAGRALARERWSWKSVCGRMMAFYA